MQAGCAYRSAHSFPRPANTISDCLARIVLEPFRKPEVEVFVWAAHNHLKNIELCCTFGLSCIRPFFTHNVCKASLCDLKTATGSAKASFTSSACWYPHWDQYKFINDEIFACATSQTRLAIIFPHTGLKSQPIKQLRSILVPSLFLQDVEGKADFEQR